MAMEILDDDNPVKFIEELEKVITHDIREVSPDRYLEKILTPKINSFFVQGTDKILTLDFVALKLSDFENLGREDNPYLYTPKRKNKQTEKSVLFRERYQPDVNISNLIFHTNNTHIQNKFVSLHLNIHIDDDLKKNNKILFINNNPNLIEEYKRLDPSILKNNIDRILFTYTPEKPFNNKFYEAIKKIPLLNNVPSNLDYFLTKLQIEENKLIAFYSTTFKFLFAEKPLGLILQFSFNTIKFENELSELSRKKVFFKRVLLYFSHLLTYSERYFSHRLTHQLDKVHVRSAINSILIDSYAHNISAHSLNFLQSLFNYRNENYLKKLYSIPHFGRLENLPLNTISYSDFFSSNQKNKEDYSDALKHYQALGISDNSNTVFDTTLLDYILYSNKFKNKKGKEIEANDLLLYDDENSKLPMPLDYAIAPLLTYLRDKGAFWSGVIRDNEATPSQIISMYDLLMEIFNNPLFIGSIMAAEEFFVVHVFIDINVYLKCPPPENEASKNDLNKNHFLTVNIKDFVEAEMNSPERKETKANSIYNYLNKDNYSNLNFVRLSESHKHIREKLEQMTVLMPGGIVGKHAFFTIVENTLRNAKHIINNHRTAIKKNGLELHFQIEDYNFMLQKKILRGIDTENTEKVSEVENKINSPDVETELKSKISKRNTKELGDYFKSTVGISDDPLLCDKIAKSLIEEKELYQIGINLNYRNTETPATYTFHDDSSIDVLKEQYDMIKSVIRSSYQPILTSEGHPRMGGSNQDKVCAAALFNKTFTSAEYPHEDVKGYYPWIAYNLCPDSPESRKKNLIYNDIFRGKSRDIINEILNQESFPTNENLNKKFNKKLYIKFFNIWKAKEVQVFEETIEDKGNNEIKRFIDTIPRYKIVVVTDADSKKALQKRAVLRILVEADSAKRKQITDKQFVEQYKNWNKAWLKDIDIDGICFKKGEKIEIGNGTDLFIDEKNDKTKLLEIEIDHDAGAEQANVCKIRNHGALLKTICGNKNHIEFINGNTTIEEAEQQELLETVLTKIFIADNRLFSLVDNYFGEKKGDKKREFILKHLGLNIINENERKDIGELKTEIQKWGKKHFFIFHLSYVDDLIKNDDDLKSAEKPIDSFIEKVFGTSISQNTIIAMTTGRGRADWLDKTYKYRSHCIHVPIESLQTAIQQGVLFKDDFDIKYNLCKVLFGS